MDENKERSQNGSLSSGRDGDMKDSRDRERGRDREAKSRSSPSRNRRRSRSPIDRKRDDRHGRGDTRASRRVYVANVPFDVRWNDVKDLFRDKIGNVTYCQLFEDENGKSRGCGLVEFQDSSSARKAIDILHRYEFRGRELVVKEDLDCERDRCGRLILPGRRNEREIERDHRDGYDDAGHSGPFNTYGLSPQFLESLNIKGPLNNRIFVANLDYKVGEHKLEEIFKLAGKVTKVKLYTDSTGNSKGHGTVEFEHPVEAVQAISMFHNQKLFGRPLSVRMDKYENDEPNDPNPSSLPAGLETVGKGLGIGGQPLNISKSMLNSQPVQQAQPPPVPAPSAALSALTNLAGNLQLPTFAQTALNQLSNVAVGAAAPAVSAASALTNSGLNISGFMSGDRGTIPGLGPTSASLANLSSNSLSSFASTAQNVLASLASSANNSNVNPIGIANPSMNQTQSNPSNLSVYSTYEREFRDDKFRPSQPVSDTIVVRNLPQNFNWQTLRDRFNEIGEVRFAEMKSAGTAVIRFRSDRDAQRAVDLMNGIPLNGRPIEVTHYF